MGPLAGHDPASSIIHYLIVGLSAPPKTRHVETHRGTAVSSTKPTTTADKTIKNSYHKDANYGGST